MMNHTNAVLDSGTGPHQGPDRGTIDSWGIIQEPAQYDPTRQTGESPLGHHGSPDFGPGHQRTPAQVVADSQNHTSRHEVTYTIAPMGRWNEDTMSGVHAFVASEGVEVHYGYQEPWGVELPNDRGARVDAVVPWDYGLSVPTVSANVRV